MVLLKDGSVLGKQSLLLFFDDGALAGLFLLLKLLLGSLGLSLGLVDCQLLLPEALDLALMLLFAHAASLSVHLLQSIVLCELLHQLALEILFHAFLFLGSFGLESELVLTSSLKLFTDANSLLSLSTLLCLGSLFRLLHIQVVSELLLEHLFSIALLFLRCQLLEDLITNGLSLLLHGTDIVLSLLLLLGVPAHHFVLVLIQFFLALE